MPTIEEITDEALAKQTNVEDEEWDDETDAEVSIARLRAPRASSGCTRSRLRSRRHVLPGQAFDVDAFPHSTLAVVRVLRRRGGDGEGFGTA